MVKNSPSSARDVGLTPGWGTKIPCAVGQLSPCPTTREPTCHSKDTVPPKNFLKEEQIRVSPSDNPDEDCTIQWCCLHRSDYSWHSSVMCKTLPLSAGWTMAQNRKEAFLESHSWSLVQPRKAYRTRCLHALPLGDTSEELYGNPAEEWASTEETSLSAGWMFHSRSSKEFYIWILTPVKFSERHTWQ